MGQLGWGVERRGRRGWSRLLGRVEVWPRARARGARTCVVVLRPGGGRRTAQEPGRQGLGTPHGGGEQRGCQRCGELRVGAGARAVRPGKRMAGRQRIVCESLGEGGGKEKPQKKKG